MANKRITEVDFIDSLTSDESFFINQNNTLKQISKKNVVMEIAQGGTGATTAAEALKKLGLTATASELNKMDGVTATTTELNYVDGVTSNIQTQLNGKATSSHNHSASNITSGTLPIARGGTGATSASAALTSLGAMPKANFSFDSSTATLNITL